jgi:hypothetical protein
VCGVPEQKLASEVLGVKGQIYGEAAACKPRIAMGARDVRLREATDQAVFGMKIMAENGRFQGDGLASDESKFEKPEIGPLRETKVSAHFGRKLQKIFPLPSNSSEPETVHILLRKIQAKLDKLLVPEDG